MHDRRPTFVCLLFPDTTGDIEMVKEGFFGPDPVTELEYQNGWVKRCEACLAAGAWPKEGTEDDKH